MSLIIYFVLYVMAEHILGFLGWEFPKYNYFYISIYDGFFCLWSLKFFSFNKNLSIIKNNY
jgi:hypothetical protein